MDTQLDRIEAKLDAVLAKFEPKKRGPRKAVVIEVAEGLPSWLPESVWRDYLAYRQQRGWPMRGRPQQIAWGMLEKVFASPAKRIERIENAMMNGWRGLVFGDDRKEKEPQGVQL